MPEIKLVLEANIELFRQLLPDIPERQKIPIAIASRIMLSALRDTMLTTAQAAEHMAELWQRDFDNVHKVMDTTGEEYAALVDGLNVDIAAG